jgi:polysaccharide pyruvyl transferase CsaB
MRVILCGYYGQDNAGDEALLVSLLQLLPANVEAIALSANPRVTQARYGIEACPSRDWRKIWQLMRCADGFIWGGGSLMQDVTSVTSPLYYAGLMFLAQRLGLKTIAWGQGIGPLTRPPIRWLTGRVLKGCDAISVRDQASAQLVQQWGLQALLAPDPVWLLQSRPSSLKETNRPIVAVNLRPHRLLTPERLQLITESLVDFQQQTQTYLRLIPFQESQDLAIMTAIADQLPGNYELVYRVDPRDCKGLFQGVTLTIGMRLHSLIMAAAEGNTCFALSYDPKVSRLMAEVGLGGWEMSDLPWTVAEISQAWQAHFHRGQPLTGQQLQEIQHQTRQHQTLLEQIMGVGNPRQMQ